MNTRIWRLAGVSLLALSISAQVLADDNNQQQQQQQRNEQQQHQQQQRGFEMQRQQQQNQRSFNEDQQRQQQQQQQQQQRQQEQVQQQRQIQQNQQERFNQQRQQQDRERNQQRDDQRQQQQQQQQMQRQQQLEQQQRQQQQQQEQRQLQNRQGGLPIQGRPDTVVQTQEPRQGFYRDQPRDSGWRGGDHRPDNGNWQGGRPSGGHGDGWGSGPRYRPGYEIDRIPGGYSRVPYRGGDYFYSGGYWYRPQGPRYVVVEPPRGARVRYLPDYAQQVWLGSALFFLAAGTYYTYEQNTQEYVVAQPPQNVEPVYSPQQPQQAANPYDVVAYPPNGKPQQEIEQDRYDCYRYAVQQSNFDPAGASYQPAPEVVGVYRQAMASCYAGRGYSVQQ